MSLQLSLDSFFKSRSKMSNQEEKKWSPTGPDNNGERKQRKRNLSLRKPKTPKKQEHSKENVIDLCSDDEDFSIATSNASITGANCSQSSVGNSSSDSSQRTVIYALTPRTPTSPRTPSAVTNSNSKSPRSKGKYFSPTKKRTITKRTPVKRKLDQEFSQNMQPSPENEIYIKACEGLDDKTIFLLSIINKFLNCASLNHLLEVESVEFLSKSLHVIKPGMRVVCRLYWRKEGWYNFTQLKAITSDKKQIDDPTLHMMLESLVNNGLITPHQERGKINMTFEDLVEILRLEDVKQICKFLKLNCQSKQDGIDALRSYSRRSSIAKFFNGSPQSNDSRVFKLMSEKAGPCYKLSDLARSTLYRLYMLMYLGMNYSIIREKKLELTIMYDKIKRETYPIDKDMQLDDASVVFENNYQFVRYVQAQLIYEEFMEKTDLNEKRDIITKVYNLYKGMCEKEMSRYKALPSWLRRFTPPNIYVKILEEGVTELKKIKTPQGYGLARDILTTLIAQVAFRPHKKAEWYSEKALILYLIDFNDEAAEVLLEAFNSNLSEEAKDSLRPRVRKIANKASSHLKDQLLQYADKDTILEKNLSGLHLYKQPMDRTNQRGKLKFETRGSAGERLVQDAEEYCLSQYIDTGGFTHGGHWEGRIVTTIFFLLFWDIIYKKPRGAVGIFLSYYQMYPLDMFCESFYINRKTLIEDRLAFIESCTTEQMLDIMSDKWNTRPECEFSGINRTIEWDSVCWAGRCLGPRRTAALCRRLATYYRYSHSGFPDLTLWNVHTGKIKFVEVKTDTDKPSMKQIQWMHYLKQCGIDTEFCYVGVNTTKPRSRPS